MPQLQLNGALTPGFPATIPEWYAISKNSVDVDYGKEPGPGGGQKRNRTFPIPPPTLAPKMIRDADLRNHADCAPTSRGGTSCGK